MPYKNYKFQVTIAGKIVAGVNKIGALTHTREVVSWRGDAQSSLHKSPGQVDYSPVTLEQGLTEDIEFNQWANKVWDYSNSAPRCRCPTTAKTSRSAS